VVIKHVYVDGQTPLDPDEAAGLIPKHIATQAELNEWEFVNIAGGQRWAKRNVKRRELLEETFVRELHRRMFDDTWRWAGTYRNSDKNIGVPWQQVGMRVHQLLENTRFQIEHQTFPVDELAVRFHRDLVWIHPFPNGNGRHARMMADILVMRLGAARFTWGQADLVGGEDARAAYIAALKVADQGDFVPLLAFARS
jgi:Fic-DOC domain mobile mystery protein B